LCHDDENGGAERRLSLIALRVILILWGCGSVRHLVTFDNPVSLDKSGPHPRTDARKSRWVYDVGMNTSHFYPKRELSPLQRARLSLGLEVDAKPRTRLAWLLRAAGLDKTAALDYLGFSSDEQAVRIVTLYYSLNATERKAVSLDVLVLAAGADPHRIWGCIQEELSRVLGMGGGILACMDALKVMRDRALTPEGYQDRRLLFQIADVLPVPGQQSVKPSVLFGSQ
jgi:hypothetical protein